MDRWKLGCRGILKFIAPNVLCFSAFEPGTIASDGKGGAITMEGTIGACVRLLRRSIFTWIDSKSERFCSGSSAHEAC